MAGRRPAAALLLPPSQQAFKQVSTGTDPFGASIRVVRAQFPVEAISSEPPSHPYGGTRRPSHFARSNPPGASRQTYIDMADGEGGTNTNSAMAAIPLYNAPFFFN